jgi:hypothetical protein
MTTRKRNILIATLVTLVAAVSIGVAAPPGFGWRGSRGWAVDENYGRLFDPKTVVTIHGTIASLTEVTPMRGMGMGVHMMLKAEAETVDVHLGPVWYLESQDADLKAGDTIEVRGSRVQIDKRPTVIAIEIKRGDDVLVLRDGDGIPRWAGSRRGRPPGPGVTR